MYYLNSGDHKKTNWCYLLKTFVNVCGKCGKKQLKFQQMENTLLEKQRMDMFMNYEDEETFDEEYEELFRQMTEKEIERHIALEKVET